MRYWNPDGYSPRIWNLRITILMDGGLTLGEAAAYAGTADRAEVIRATVDRFRQHGFTAAEALPWYLWDFNPAEAVVFAHAGWRPNQGAALWRLALASVPGRSFDGVPDLVTGWLDTGIPPHRALPYLAAGITPDQAPDLEQRRANGENIDPGIATLAALRWESCVAQDL
jgi:hypothetical protein